jgi:hypothetical protein
MVSNLTNTYDKQAIADVFTRYHQNSRLLEILATEIETGTGSHHLSIGFSGRLSLFDTLAELLTVVNLSRTQIDWGIWILGELLAIYTAALKGKTTQGNPIWQYFDENDRRRVVQAIDEQIAVLRKFRKTPRRPLAIQSLCFDITDDKNLLPSRIFTSLSMIDVLLHIPNIDPVFKHLAHVLQPGGKAILTFYPPCEDWPSSDTETPLSLDKFIVEVAAAHGTMPQEVYSGENGTVSLCVLKRTLESLPSGISPLIMREYWLDLPAVWVHREKHITETASQYGLDVHRAETVPGGMFPVTRRVLVLRRRRES